MTRVVDVHAHVLPRLLVEMAAAEQSRWGIDFAEGEDGRFEYRVGGRWRPLLQQSDVYGESPDRRAGRMTRIGVDTQVLSLSPSFFLYLEDRADALAYCSDLNDAVAGFVAAQPGRFLAFGMLPLEHPQAAASELERVLGQGFVGAVVGTHVNGKDWDHPTLTGVLEAAEALGAAVFVHPASVRPAELLARHQLRNLVGNPLETTLAIASMVFGGVLDRFPGLRLGFAHGGGFGVFDSGRFDHGARARPELDLIAAPSDYLRRMWFDCLTHDETALRFLIDRVGADRIVLGSDDPADMGLAEPVSWLEGCSSLSPEEMSSILSANPARWLNLDPIPPRTG
ncbi:MAG TPA: amidohydrolase family protein [Acidimicrobiia bacterium]|nr:amidohydrolase family protein [Acidimicrobiia bacterium]